MTLEQLNERPLSYSSLKQFAISPAHYMAYLNKPRKETPELLFGSALHCILLTPELFNDSYLISRKFDMRKNADKEEYNALLSSAEQTGKKIIQDDMHTDLINLTDIVKENLDFQTIICNSQTEKKDLFELYGLPFIAIKDIVRDNITIDIKTVQNASLEAINKDFFNYQYYLQAAIYGGDFAFYIIEKNEPYYNGLLEVEQEFIDYGLTKLEKLCSAFNYALENPDSFKQSYDFWYNYDQRKPIISLPNWAK